MADDIRAASGAELEKLSRALFDDKMRFNKTLVALAEGGTLNDFMRIADVLSFAPIEAGDKITYHAADKREPVGKRFIDLFTAACRAEAYPERKYIAVLIAVRYAPTGSELYIWQDGAVDYLTRRAKQDFDFVADCLDTYDKKFINYDILLAVDRPRATERLVNKLLNEKYFNKPAARAALVGCGELVDTLIALFNEADAKTRVMLARILLLFKNDHTARDFIKDKAKSDPAKTVREVFEGAAAKRIADPVKFFLKLMTSGESIPYSEWRAIQKGDSGEGFCAVADRLFFYTVFDGRKKVLLYNDGGFIGTDDRRVALRGDAPIYVLHPATVPADERDILSLDIEQPFLQLKRPVYYANAEELYRSTRIAGTMIDRESFDAAFRALGFRFAADTVGIKRTAVIVIGGYALGVECDMPSTGDTVDCGAVTYYCASELIRNNREIYISSISPVSCLTIPPAVFSELTYAAYRLFGCVE